MIPIITIDTDNAVIRLYPDRAAESGIGELAIRQLRRDLETLALGLNNAHRNATYHVQVMP